MRRRVFLPLCVCFCLLVSGCFRRHESNPLSPEDALKSFRLNEDFRIELFAAEPYVVDPVEVVFDEEGRAFAAEMLDLPDDPPPGKPARGRIRFLEDTDDDGRVDRSTIFADNLLQVTSVLPWNGGLLVTAAPDILYLKDTDGDGKADVRKVLFTGFALVNPESRITNLRFNIDNWIYASNNGQRGSIIFPERPASPPVSVLGADFRFRLDRGLFEAESGPTQFGQAMDDWGHRFITENTIHVRQVVLPRRYLSRNPFLAVGSPAQDISDHGQPSAPIFPLTGPQYWREVRTRMRQERYRENRLERARPLNPSTEMASGYFSAAAGGTIYSGDTFSDRYRGNLFTGDVSANLVHRDILTPEGVTFVASRPEEEKNREFLVSTDPWFRPCNFANAPDGNLYIVDMYREFIETPESIPEELKKDMNFYSGDTMGRIYRIVPKNAPPSKLAKPNLTKADSAELVRLLSHRNAWWRLTAQRMLLERQDRSVIPLLTRMASETDFPPARLHALYALEGMSALEPALVEAAIEDPQYGVREHAVRLAERFPELEGKVSRMIEDPSPHVQLQMALSLGEFLVAAKDRAATARERMTVPASRPLPDGRGSVRALEALAALAVIQGENRYFRTAILSSSADHPLELLQLMVRQSSAPAREARGMNQFLSEIALLIGAGRDAGKIQSFLRLISSAASLATEDRRVAGLTGLARGLQISGVTRFKIPSAEGLLKSVLTNPSEKVQIAARSVARHFELHTFLSVATKESLEGRLAPARRVMAIYSLAGGAYDQVRPVFQQLLSANLEPELMKATIQSLSLFDEAEVGALLVSRWKSLGPSVRNDVLDVMLGHRQRVAILLDAIESGQIERNALDLSRKEKLLRNPDEKIASRSRQVLREQPSDRVPVLQAFRSALEETGDAARGKELFEKNCAICHMHRKGRRVGPDLSGVSSETKMKLLEDILHPSKAIQPAYMNYVVITRDGRIHDGLIAAETPGALTLRRSDNEDATILRSNIAEIRASPISLMPDGFEQSLGKRDIADVIAYLQGTNLRPRLR